MKSKAAVGLRFELLGDVESSDCVDGVELGRVSAMYSEEQDQGSLCFCRYSDGAHKGRQCYSLSNISERGVLCEWVLTERRW